MKHANLIAGLAIAMGAAGAPASALAQIDLSGVWAPIMHEDQIERVPGPDVGDYAGLPINAAMRLRADTWDASLLTLPEHQCKPHPSTYGFRGVGNLRIAFEFDDASQRLVKINTQIQWMEQKREIWMDGRPHRPEYAAHTAASIGDEGVLMVDTMPEPLADKLLAEVRRLAGNKPIRLHHQHSFPSGPYPDGESARLRR